MGKREQPRNGPLLLVLAVIVPLHRGHETPGMTAIRGPASGGGVPARRSAALPERDAALRFFTVDSARARTHRIACSLLPCGR